MKFEWKSLNSRLARRIFATFIACAMIPVIILATLSLYQVSNQLEAQAYQRLRRAAKSHGLSIYEHLMFCEDELRLVNFRPRSDISQQKEKFSAMGRYFPDGRYEAVFGDPIPALSLTSREQAHLKSGASLLVVTSNTPIEIILASQFDTGSKSTGLLVGTVRAEYLWGIEKGNSLPPLSEFSVISTEGLPLYRSVGWPAQPAAVDDYASKDNFRMQHGEIDWLVAQWSLFLEPKFAVGSWSLIVMQPEDHMLAPIARFKLIFVLVVILAILLVVVLSLFSLRHSLGPIDALKKGARRIADKDFDHRVKISSRDEFRDLAESFNSMSDQLGVHFNYLVSQEKIDRATLSGKNFGQITGLSITCLLKDYSLMRVSIARVNTDTPDEELIYVGQKATPDSVSCHSHHIAKEHLARFSKEQLWVVLDDPAELALYLPTESLLKTGMVTLFPVYVAGKLFAILTAACRPDEQLTENTLSLIRQVADHLSVAWSNLNLIQDLRRLTIGSMQALARAVDAKSSWTAGHSARVMRISRGIARRMGLAPERIDRLEQAALLHDIGKIGISSGILDKPGRLTEEELATIKTHSVIGSNILAPIPAFKAITPVVRQHHEHWDGKGYPDGLSGDAIIMEARILSVSDVYDAMTSDRPYRKGMDLERAVAMIKAKSGSQLDPSVVSAFLDLIQKKSSLAA